MSAFQKHNWPAWACCWCRARGPRPLPRWWSPAPGSPGFWISSADITWCIIMYWTSATPTPAVWLTFLVGSSKSQLGPSKGFSCLLLKMLSQVYVFINCWPMSETNCMEHLYKDIKEKFATPSHSRLRHDKNFFHVKFNEDQTIQTKYNLNIYYFVLVLLPPLSK